MQHEGYTARLEYDDASGAFHGRVLGIQDVITFEGRSVAELRREFARSVAEYVAMCAEQGEEPQRPFSGRFVVRVPADLHQAAAGAAAGRLISLNAWVEAAMRAYLEAGGRRRRVG